MKRKINDKLYDSITLNKSYIVLSIEVYDMKNSNFAQSVGNHILYRIENDNGSVVPYPSALFQVKSGKLSKGWAAIQSHECFQLIPESWTIDGFWEKYYNDDNKTLELYKKEKQSIFLEELTTNEIINIIMRNEDSMDKETILYALINHKDERFIDTILEYSRKSLQNDIHYYSSIEVSHSLVLAFIYLSKFNSSKVEDYFIEYLSEPALKKQLTDIVNSYFT
ncbi:hypothetical protein [Paenibacillus lemnae]|uniref:Uncharacterized protein n=1 Tax=Paenibacillus lemnae TaxID=1330551 RepID=A0A848M250_PAELE|nr:hypothetical protein [Paenibacillus lemnae]NMO94331.1 hypothetical protein [Paenibacillus lemnae]